MLATKVVLCAVFAVPILVGQGSPGTTPDPAKRALIEEVFRLTQPQKLMGQMLDQYRSAFSKGFEQSFTAEVKKFDDPAKYRPAFEKMEDRMFAVLSDALSWENLKPEMVQLYSDTFSTDELSGIVAFYKSPAGQAYLQKLPALMKKGGEIGQQHVMGALPEIKKMSDDFMADLKKAHDANPAPAPK